jgi:hypothetical protein
MWTQRPFLRWGPDDAELSELCSSVVAPDHILPMHPAGGCLCLQKYSVLHYMAVNRLQSVAYALLVSRANT